MTLEEQVTNLELSKKLKELGVKQESLVGWMNNGGEKRGKTYLLYIDETTTPGDAYISSGTKFLCSAFTVAELGEMLPQVVYHEDEPFGILLSTSDESFVQGKWGRWPKKWKVWYEDLVIEESVIGFSEENEANARAKMIIFLKEHKLIK